ncbi:MAG: UDP-N-acetylmuramate--L-alanine ligase [Clostridiales bacterium]|nr:UDP-N-acetylmuramate--L-alanine ligase [Clostridiales bacterium]
MKYIDIKQYKNKRIHFIGIGGISMSGLAEYLHTKGYNVTGSDVMDSYIISDLQNKGIKIAIGHKASNIEGADLVVFTSAIITNGENPEMAEAKKQNIPLLNRAALMGQIMSEFPRSVAVAGTHGKTTSTSMLSIIMTQAQLDPTIFVGGKLDGIGGNVRVGKGSYFLVEACEFSGSFLEMDPYMAIVLNIDNDHLDYFKDMDEIYDSFYKFANLVPDNGFLIGCVDDPLVNRLMTEVKRHNITFSIGGKADWVAQDLKYDKRGNVSFRASYKNQDMGRFTLNVPGKHNIYNALAAIAAAWALGVSQEVIRYGLASYTGTHRRFETKGIVEGVTIIDDYGHHPTEIRLTLEAAQNYPHKKLWCVFQPYTFSRTKLLFDDFLDAFHGAHEVIITDIMGGREQDTGEIHALDLVDALKARGKVCRYLPTFEDVVNFLSDRVEPGDVVITTGCGNVYLAAEMLIQRMQEMLVAASAEISDYE